MLCTSENEKKLPVGVPSASRTPKEKRTFGGALLGLKQHLFTLKEENTWKNLGMKSCQ